MGQVCVALGGRRGRTYRLASWMLLAVTATVSVLASSAHAIPPWVEDAQGHRAPAVCATDTVWKNRKAAMAAAAGPQAAVVPACGEGDCDDPAVRDAAGATAKTVRVIVHVMNSANGTAPDGVNQAAVDAQIQTLNDAYAGLFDLGTPGTNVQFDLVATRYHDDKRFYCIPKYDQSGRWYTAINQMKDQYAEAPDQALNVFVSCMDWGQQGVLLGIGTFPWDPDALGPRGGIWMNSGYFGGGERTLPHEVGHCLGLWHTHHGVSEVNSCGDGCFEAPDDPNANIVGDLCADTPATPTNYACTDPSDAVCNVSNWGVTATDNYMGYGPDSCIDEFSPEQIQRMHCWTTDHLTGWLDAGCVPSGTEVCDGSDNDCDGNVDEDVSNACGGCSTLDANPGDACGACGNGTVMCEGADATMCAGDSANACGGCSALPGNPGDACGACGSQACDGPDAVSCNDPGVNSCGGCAALAATPGDSCGSCGTIVCDGSNATSCQDPCNICAPSNASCSADGDCCSGHCKGKPGSRTCK